MTNAPRVLTLAAAAAVIAGCGSSGGGQVPQAKITPSGGQVAAATPEPAAPSSAPALDPSAEAATLDKKLAAAERKARKTEAARSGREIAKLKKAQAKARAQRDTALASSTASALAAAMGYSSPTVTVTDGARTVAVTLGEQGACGAPTSGTDTLAARVQRALPFVKRSTVSVGGMSLSSFAAARCAWSSLPAAHTVASAQGTGDATVQAFRVGRGTWTVDYGTSGTFLSVLVLQDAQILAGSAAQRGAGAGRTTFVGPGTFTIRIAGDGRWAVQVRRGG